MHKACNCQVIMYRSTVLGVNNIIKYIRVKLFETKRINKHINRQFVRLFGRIVYNKALKNFSCATDILYNVIAKTLNLNDVTLHVQIVLRYFCENVSRDEIKNFSAGSYDVC